MPMASRSARTRPRRMTRTFWGMNRQGEWHALRKAGYRSLSQRSKVGFHLVKTYVVLHHTRAWKPVGALEKRGRVHGHGSTRKSGRDAKDAVNDRRENDVNSVMMDPRERRGQDRWAVRRQRRDDEQSKRGWMD